MSGKRKPPVGAGGGGAATDGGESDMSTSDYNPSENVASSSQEALILTGASDTKITLTGIDWLSASFPLGTDVQRMLPAPFAEFSGEVLKSLQHFRDAVGLDGGRVDWVENNPKQRMLLTCSGQDCQYMTANGLDWSSALAGVAVLNGRVTRLDVCIDVFGMPATPAIDALVAAIKSDAMRDGSLDTIRYQGVGKRAGDTLYVGAAGDEARLRVYDKGAEQGEPVQWMRVELQLRGEKAKWGALLVQLQGVVLAVPEILRGYVDFPGVEWWAEALGAVEGVPLEPTVRKPGNKRRWYTEQVIPAMLGDLYAGDEWLRQAMYGALDVTEGSEAHGGADTRAKLSRRGRKGLALLTEYGIDGPARWGLTVAGQGVISALCEGLGYVWDTKEQGWRRGD